MLAIEHSKPSPASRTSRSNDGFGDYFRYHGWLSPGVRLFRKINFQAKSICISLAFLTPLVLALYFLWTSAHSQTDIANSEREGLAYSSNIVHLIKAAHARRLSATTNSAQISELQTQEQASFALMQRQHALYGKEFKAEDAFQSANQLHEQLQRTPLAADSETTFVLHNRYIDALLKLNRAVADGSQLTLDPDLDTFHMMNIAVVRGLSLWEITTRLRGSGVIAMKDNALSPLERDTLLEDMAIQQELKGEIENAYEQGIKGDPSAAKLDIKPLIDAVQAQRQLVRSQLLGATLSTDSASYLATSNRAADAGLALIEEVSKELDLRLQARSDRITRALWLELGIALLCVAVAGYLLLAFYKVMMGGLQEVSGHLEQITKGNLTTAPTPWGSDEAAHLMVTLGQMQASLRHIAAIVIESSANVQVASEEIASASSDLSSRTEDNAANLEETAASMEQISATIKNSNEAVDNAAVIVNSNAIAATRGGEVIAQVVSTMAGIQSSSKKIVEIISVIDGIAFQTNILALNAAVEAARAGEQGRGFAVVATEVRNLAHRSASAAKEIKELINASLEQVNAGGIVAEEAGRTIHSIVENARKIDSLMGEISRASDEQSSGIKQVGSAVDTLDQSTQQNAALVEETAAASATLSEQAQRLSEEIAFFKLA
ncbi:MAG: methyl-accepting chemotaxis protein [Sphingomonadaceae bacterium]